MSAERVAMRHVREILRLKQAGLATREIGRRVNVAPSTVRVTVARFHAAGLTWPLAEDISNRQLEGALYANAGTKRSHRRRAVPDWAQIRLELQRKHVTLQILWEEYIERHPDGYQYSRFCDLYHTWLGTLSLTMRQTHLAGDKLFVDYAGDTVSVVIDRLRGEIRKAQIFVAVLGASGFIYAEATWTQGLSDWIGAHTRAFASIGGCPRLLVPDNTKVAVIKACFYDPQLNRTYAEMAAHYDTAILPARPRKPRDKAKVEVSVLMVERWLLGRLRNQRFHGLAELNDAIRALLINLNETRVIRRLGQTRVTDRTVEIFLDGELIAAHLRLANHGKHTILPAHMPSSHRRYADWSIERIHRDASAIGPAAALLCELILEERPHPEQGFRACMGIVRLIKPFGRDRVEAAATRAVELGARTYGSVKSILDNNLDRQAAPQRASDGKTILHPNIRGARYYN